MDTSQRYGEQRQSSREKGGFSERAPCVVVQGLVSGPSGRNTSVRRIKESIAAVTCDTDGYAEMKDPVVDLVFVVAEAWARRANWEA
jgi:hypothetical protein